jgi:hypothetical protein
MLPVIIGLGELVAPFLVGAGVGAGVDLIGYGIYKGIVTIKGIITRIKVQKALEKTKNILKAEIKSKSHNHVSLSTLNTDGKLEDITLYGDGVADDVRVGELIYV